VRGRKGERREGGGGRGGRRKGVSVGEGGECGVGKKTHKYQGILQTRQQNVNNDLIKTETYIYI
jgi:hypothetical protein